VEDWLLHGAIYEALREERAARESSALPEETRGAVGKAPFWHWFALAAGIMAAVLAGWQLFQTPKPSVVRAIPAPAPPAETRPVAGLLTRTGGEVWVAPAGRTNANPVSDAQATLYSGDAIRTGSNTVARFTYPDGSSLAIYHDTRLMVGLTNSALRLEVAYGAVDAAIRPQPAGRDMLVTTKFMRSDIVGTEFRLMVDSTSAWLGVREGKVEVTRVSDGQKILLGQANYAAVHPQWPYMKMNPLVCPVWKGVCQRAAGTAYP
jgi:ferric-dicitrate binding protein FerR (iron transport regulator)